MWWWPLMACSGGPVEPTEPAPALPDLPSGWAATPEPAAAALKREARTCRSGPVRFSWEPDLTFEVATPRAKFAGTWRPVDDGIVYLTTGPIGDLERCSAARFLPDVLLCAEGPIGCAGQPWDWAIEVVDDGAGPEATELVARALGRVDGTGVVFRSPTVGSEGSEIAIRYRKPPDNTRRTRVLAEQVAALLERDLETSGVDVTEDPEAASPVVVRVGGTVQAR